MTVARALAQWAHDQQPDAADRSLARRALADTVAVALAARDHPLRSIAGTLPPAARWAAMAHVLDFDDLHTGTTTHISVVTVPAVLAAGGWDGAGGDDGGDDRGDGDRAYLAGAGVMARLGTLLGWDHYAAGWHATCTAGAPAAAVAAGVAMGLDAGRLATAMALAVPAAGGVQEAFGTHSKALQVGFAADAGVRAARLARAGATADPRALDAWLERVGGSADAPLPPPAPIVPGGLAVKMFPCCYAMQRPIAALREVRDELPEDLPGNVTAVTVSTPAGALHPLIHDHPTTGLEGKFSMPYAVAAALLDRYPGFGSFTDAAVNRPEARELMHRVRVEPQPVETSTLLDGTVAVRVELTDGRVVSTELALPPGAPGRSAGEADMRAKFAACGPDVPTALNGLTWSGAAGLMRDSFTAADREPGN